MARFLAFLMIFAVVVANGSSVAAAICQHQNIGEHVAARQSGDLKIAAVSLHEEAAAAAASKKGSQSASASVQWPTEMLPAGNGAEPFRAVEPVRYQRAVTTPLESTSSRPLLEPPSA
ncbi:MAG: hypothetical protein ACXW2T_09795 [Allosphingosinicella sp.]